MASKKTFWNKLKYAGGIAGGILGAGFLGYQGYQGYKAYGELNDKIEDWNRRTGMHYSHDYGRMMPNTEYHPVFKTPGFKKGGMVPKKRKVVKKKSKNK